MSNQTTYFAMGNYPCGFFGGCHEVPENAKPVATTVQGIPIMAEPVKAPALHEENNGTPTVHFQKVIEEFQVLGDENAKDNEADAKNVGMKMPRIWASNPKESAVSEDQGALSESFEQVVPELEKKPILTDTKNPEAGGLRGGDWRAYSNYDFLNQHFRTHQIPKTKHY